MHDFWVFMFGVLAGAFLSAESVLMRLFPRWYAWLRKLTGER